MNSKANVSTGNVAGRGRITVEPKLLGLSATSFGNHAGFGNLVAQGQLFKPMFALSTTGHVLSTNVDPDEIFEETFQDSKQTVVKFSFESYFNCSPKLTCFLTTGLIIALFGNTLNLQL